MHNTWTLNYLGDKQRRSWTKSLYKNQKYQREFEREQAEAATQELISQDGTFDFYAHSFWGTTPLAWCIEHGEENHYEMALMPLELGATCDDQTVGSVAHQKILQLEDDFTQFLFLAFVGDVIPEIVKNFRMKINYFTYVSQGFSKRETLFQRRVQTPGLPEARQPKRYSKDMTA